MARTIKLALLTCEIPLALVESHGDYPTLYKKLLESSLPASSGVDFTVDSFDVVKGEYPPEEIVGDYDGFLISGSASSVYAPLPWIPPLLAFVSALVSKHPNVKVFGICFGHQIVARALGGECIRNESGWEMGVTDVALTEVGRSIFGTDILHIQQMHRDHVPLVPPSFELLGSSSKSPVQGMVRFNTPTTHPTPSLSDIHILTVQGHPEFTTPMIHDIIDFWRESGIFNDQDAKEGWEFAKKDHDGVKIVGKTMWKVLRVA